MMQRLLAACMLALALLSLPAAHAAEQADEVPVLIAESIDARGHPLPTPPIIAAVVQQLAAESGLNLVVRAYP